MEENEDEYTVKDFDGTQKKVGRKERVCEMQAGKKVILNVNLVEFVCVSADSLSRPVTSERYAKYHLFKVISSFFH